MGGREGVGVGGGEKECDVVVDMEGGEDNKHEMLMKLKKGTYGSQFMRLNLWCLCLILL